MESIAVEKGKVLSEDGRNIRLRGISIGGFLNMEHFINGYPGYETSFRNTVSSVIGEEKAYFYFDRLENYFLNEEDLIFLKSIGVNLIRVAVNYRHFVEDKLLSTYNNSGFKHLDRIINSASNHGIYIIIDLHSAPGWQNPGWHSDNPYQANLLWYSSDFQQKTSEIWEAIAERYADEPCIGGYGLLNEPDAPSSLSLTNLYNKLIGRIRKRDKDHIIIVEANQYGTNPTGLNGVDDENIIVEIHYYPSSGFTDDVYPREKHGIVEGTEYYGRKNLKEELLKIAEPIMEWNKPIYLGEFGSIYWNSKNDVYRLKVNEDLIGICEEFGIHWTIWTYKDVGIQGLVYPKAESEFMRVFSNLLNLKYKLGADSWGPSISSKFKNQVFNSFINSLKSEIHKLGYEFSVPITNLEGELLGNEYRGSYSFTATVRRNFNSLISIYLAHQFASKLKGLKLDELDKIAGSFSYKNCAQRLPLINLIKKFT